MTGFLYRLRNKFLQDDGIGTIEVILILVVIYTQMLAGQVWGIP